MSPAARATASLSTCASVYPFAEFSVLASPAIREAYCTGRGKVVIRARTSVEEWMSCKQMIAISEIPYQLNKSRLLETMAGQAAVAVENAEMANALHRADRRSRASGRSSRPELTDREREILRLLVGGATNREVGDQLHLSHNTIKFHIRQLLEKAGVSNRTELATKAALQGWV